MLLENCSFGANDFVSLFHVCFFREDKGDQILDYKQEIQTMEEQLKKLQKEVQTAWFSLLDSFVKEETSLFFDTLRKT